MTAPDYTVIPDAQKAVCDGMESLREAVAALERGNLSDAADELAREIKMLSIFNEMLTELHKAPDWPEGVETVGPKMLRQAQGVERDSAC